MNQEAFAEVSDVFLAARALDGHARESFLTRRCANCPDVREAVERLLAEDGDRSDGFDDSAMIDGIHLDAFQGLFTANGSRHTAAAIPEAPLPESIGRFRIIRKLGEGGMGIVCEAEQDNPRRSVALKLLRMGIGSPGMARRFAHEAQVLARLHHPGIARIYEAGSVETPTGAQPYFAMELIEGCPLLEHVEKLPTPERLRLFLLICEAVEYAHRKGVIHRDLKPANILVDEHGSPRILDFGVARVTDADLQVTTMQTSPGQLVGTLPYMSPEQVSGSSDGVDTRTDVYALGVILFQLLSGRLPYDTRTKSVAEAARIIREQEPTRLGSLDTALRGDLETIVSRALEKEASRRYQSAASLAADVSRYLADEPIEARPPTRLYQLRKFAKRHPELVAGLGVAAVTLILGLVGTSWGLIRATHQRNEAFTQSGIAAQKEAAAVREAAKAKRLAAAMQKVLDAANPQSAAGYSEGPVEVLTQAARDIAHELADEPESEWTVRMTLARTFHGLGAPEPRTVSLRVADEIARTHFGPVDSRSLETKRALAKAYVEWVATGASPAWVQAAAGPYVREALEEARRTLGDGDLTTISLLNDRAYLEAYIHSPGALSLQVELVEALRALRPEQRPCPLAFALSRLALCCARVHDEAGAEAAAEESLSIVRSGLEPGDDLTLTRQLGLPEFLCEYDRIPETIELLHRYIERIERTRGKSHPSAVAATTTLAGLYQTLGDTRSAVLMSAESLAGFRALNGRWSPASIYEVMRHANYLALDQQIDHARTTWQEALEVARNLDEGHPLQRAVWCAAQLTCGLRNCGAWSSTCLRAEANFAFHDALGWRKASLQFSDIRWDEFSFSLTRFDGRGAPECKGTLADLWSMPGPPAGLYRLAMSVPVEGKACDIDEWVLVTPWHIRKYGPKFRDLRRADQWAIRKAEPPDEEVDTTTFTTMAWPPRDLGPHGRGYCFGLIAETRIELPPGTYEFALAADDCGALFIDGERILEAWPESGFGAGGTVQVKLTPGQHSLRLEYVQWGGLARLRLRVTPMDLSHRKPTAGP